MHTGLILIQLELNFIHILGAFRMSSVIVLHNNFKHFAIIIRVKMFLRILRNCTFHTEILVADFTCLLKHIICLEECIVGVAGAHAHNPLFFHRLQHLFWIITLTTEILLNLLILILELLWWQLLHFN